MSRSALDRISSIASLANAWHSIWSRASARSRRSFGIDGQTLFDFDSNRTTRCRELSTEIRSPESYQFSGLVAHLIPKSSGKDRVICVPTVRDRVVQRALSEYLADGDRCGLRNAVSYGFIPERSVGMAVRQARNLRRNHQWAYKTDITSFFDSIDRERLHQTVRAVVKDRSLHDLLNRAAHCEIIESGSSRQKRIHNAGIRLGRGVRQGMPLSPFFANAMLKRFDRAVESTGTLMVRYADDLICFADSELACEKIHGVVTGALAEEGLNVPGPGPGSKTAIISPNEPAEFLGLSLRPDNGNYLLEVGSKQTAKIRQRIIELADITNLSKQGINIGGFFRRLDGAVAGYEGAYSFADNAGHVATVLEHARAAAARRLFESELGLSLAGMSDAKKRFLGVID